MLCCLKEFEGKAFGDAALNSDNMSLYEIFISMYLKETRNLVKHGIKSAYIQKDENLTFYKGKLNVSQALTMYVPKNGKPTRIEHGRWTVGMSFEDVDYVDWSDLEDFYTEYARYPHKCDKCGESMRILKKGEEMICPDCKVPLDTTNILRWD